MVRYERIEGHIREFLPEVGENHLVPGFPENESNSLSSAPDQWFTMIIRVRIPSTYRIVR